MIFTNSRYAGQTVLRVEGSDGVSRPTLYRQKPPPTTRFLHYTVSYGDRLDKLAAAFYADDTQWWRIADANPEVFFPTTLVPGSIIRIPQT
jgi:nucleoid-associated protein YgaU